MQVAAALGVDLVLEVLPDVISRADSGLHVISVELGTGSSVTTEIEHFHGMRQRTHRQEIHARSGRDVSISAVYTTLDRLETKGLVESWTAPPTGERGGRRRKCYAARPAGVAAVRQAYSALTAMAEGLEARLEVK